jgi:hypothetical protein
VIGVDMWECARCGHKSGTRRTSSHGCDHEWWDENELAWARKKQREKERQEQEQQTAALEQLKAAAKRELMTFNDELLNTEKGRKLLSGEEGYSWLEDKKWIRWFNSSFGTDWLCNESGKTYLNFLYENVLAIYKNSKIEEINFCIKEIEDFVKEMNYENHFGYGANCCLRNLILRDYLQTEQGKLWVAHLINELRALAKRKHDEKIGCGCLIILIIIGYIIYRWWF